MNRLAKRLERIARDVTAADEGMKFVIDEDYVLVRTFEDDYKEGELGRDSLSEITVHGKFDTIDALLRYVCEQLGVSYDKGDWEYEIRDEFPGVRFSGGLGLFTEDNLEADESELKEWKKGEKKLWGKVVYIVVQKVGITKPDEADLVGFSEV